MQAKRDEQKQEVMKKRMKEKHDQRKTPKKNSRERFILKIRKSSFHKKDQKERKIKCKRKELKLIFLNRERTLFKNV